MDKKDLFLWLVVLAAVLALVYASGKFDEGVEGICDASEPLRRQPGCSIDGGDLWKSR